MDKHCIKYHLTVQDTAITPRGPLPCGTEGDDKVAQLTFAGLAEGYTYRLELVTGAGQYDITAPLAVADGTATWDIPTAWTAAGTAALRLIRLEINGGNEVSRFYYPPVLLRFDYRDEGSGGVTAAPLWQEYLTRAEQAMDEQAELTLRAEAAATMARPFSQAAAESASEANHHAETAAQHADRAEAAAAQCGETLAAVEELCGITASVIKVVSG